MPHADDVRVDRWGSTSPQVEVVDPKYSDTDVLTSTGGWSDASHSAQVDVYNEDNGKKAACAKIQPGGALAFRGSKSDFNGKLVLQSWVKTSQGVPQLTLDISGSGVRCSCVLFDCPGQCAFTGGCFYWREWGTGLAHAMR